jgi:broad specificity phosphatase PhoE
MHLIIIRHGETDWNAQQRIQGRADTPLNATGVAQAEKLAARVAADGALEALYSSPQQRARVTAETIAQRVSLAPILDERLVEKSLGEVEGLTTRDLEQKNPELYRLWHESTEHVQLPGEESLVEFQQRVRLFIADLQSRHASGARVAIVSHGATIGMLFTTLMGWELNKRVPFWFDNASVSWIDCTRTRPRIRLLNDTCHLRNDSHSH